MKTLHKSLLISLLTLTACQQNTGLTDSNDQRTDHGLHVQQLLGKNSEALFGIKKPLTDSAPATKEATRYPEQPASDQVLLAEGLAVEYLTRSAANWTDMMAFWPSDEHPSHLITCVEGSRKEIKPGKWNPSVQRISLKDGKVETLLRGMHGCDGIRRTPWQTILVTEERADGAAYEILKPLQLNNVVVLDRSSGKVSDPGHLAKRSALPMMSWEGLTILESGVIIAGDELRPGSYGLEDNDGGSIYKFVPAKLRSGTQVIRSLDDSPLVNGSVYAMRIDCRAPGVQWGQGCETGHGGWVKVDAGTARADANDNGATGYYRPEDLHKDPLYQGEGIRFCWANTGNERSFHYGEVMCAVDVAPSDPDSVVRVNRFLEGDRDFNSVDNLAFQPQTGILYITEDHRNGDVFACLPDGKDRDLKSDGCIKVLSVKDSSAEPTGFMFSADGKTAYLSIQHSKDGKMPKVDEYPTDDLLKITGFKIPNR